MADQTLVHTTNGPVQGVKKTSLLGDEYLSYQRIPYAEPPVGELRFRVSQVTRVKMLFMYIIYYLFRIPYRQKYGPTFWMHPNRAHRLGIMILK